MKDIVADTALIARCGLYCGACGKFLQGKCAGCAENVRAAWCKVRECCSKVGKASCAECSEHADVMKCSSFNNIFSKIFGLIFRSDRAACVALIRAQGPRAYARYMAEHKIMTLRRK